jgi:uncharacterized damage-inducible protein DinB
MKKLIYLFILVPMMSYGQAPSVQQEFTGGTAYNKNHIVQLINAIPEDKLSWKSNDDVRSVSEVVAHIAATNYMFGSFLGTTPLPESGKDWQSFEKTLTSKKQLLKAINESFAYIDAAATAVESDDLTTQVELPFGTFTKRNIMAVANSHCAEHKGQFIAYARFMGITPPWSQGKDM